MYPTNLPIKTLDNRQLSICENTLDSVALAASIIHRITHGIPTSVVRESDGERCIIQYGKTGKLTRFLRDDAWLRKYGVYGADLKHVAAELLRAGNMATYLGAPIAGFWKPKYDIYQHFPERKTFISVFYHRDWVAKEILGDVLQCGKVMVLHRDHEMIAEQLRQQYNLEQVESCKLGSWQDHAAVHLAVARSSAKILLVSGGPSGKALVVDLAARYGRVALDVGNGMTKAICPGVVESLTA